MSTRGAYGIRKNDQDKVTYNHSDSYPDSLGAFLLDQLSKSSLDKLNKIYDNMVLVEDGIEDGLYQELREYRGDLTPYLTGELTKFIDNQNFLGDSLFCEYAYIINLDSGMFEFYKGFNRSPNGRSRYADKFYGGYCGVELVLEIPLTDICGWTSRDNIDYLVEQMWSFCG